MSTSPDEAFRARLQFYYALDGSLMPRVLYAADGSRRNTVQAVTTRYLRYRAKSKRENLMKLLNSGKLCMIY